MEETQLDRIEKLVGERAYGWREQSSITLECMASVSIAASGVSAGPGHVAIILKDEDAIVLRDRLIRIYGYPDQVLVTVGDPGPNVK